MRRVYQTPKLEIFEYRAKVNLLQYSGENSSEKKGLFRFGPECEDNDCFELGFMNIPGHSPRA